MKTLIKKTLLIAGLLTLSTGLWAQLPPPPPGDHGSGSNQNGGNAPIGSGLFILMGMAAAYGGKKLFSYSEEEPQE